MSHELKPYPANRDSGVEWLGEVPEHWEMRRLKTIARIRYGLGRPPRETETGLPLIRATNIKRGRIVAKNLVSVDPADVPRSRNALLSVGEIIVVRSGAYTADSAIVSRRYDGAVAGYDMIVTVRTGRPEFVAWALLSDYVRVAQLVTASMRSAQPHLNAEELGGAILALPSLAEQAAIARFLDHVDRRIRRYIRSKQKLIALLHEQRQAIIHRAVTRGLDPDVRLKPSGVEWLGDVPAHWAVGSLKRFVDKRPGAIKAGPFGSQLRAAEMMGTDFKVYTQRNVIDRNLDQGVNYVSRPKFEELRAFEVFAGDVLVTSRGTIGRTALVTGHSQRGILHPCLLRVHPDYNRLVPEFLMALIQDSQLLPQQLTLLSNATTIDVIYSGTLANTIIPVPPRSEQRDILEYVGVKTGNTGHLVTRALREISLLREYRTRLIADVVTGKLDVREAAAHLPEETDEPEPLDDTDTSPEDITEAPEAPDPDALEEAEA